MICLFHGPGVKIGFTIVGLNYPRQFKLAKACAGRMLTDKDMQAFAGKTWVLDLLGVKQHLERHFQKIDQGQGWSLWRLRPMDWHSALALRLSGGP
jgi:hypothetical protein